MANISDIIEQFLLENLGEEQSLDLSRNDLAEFFRCAPSQINYVLATRFNLDRGFFTESQRGGGGYIRLVRVDLDKNDYIHNLVQKISGQDVDFTTGINIVDGLVERGLVSYNEGEIVKSTISPKALSNPLRIENKIRSNILKSFLSNLAKGGR